uniref:Uncharacterized protein n=1 Tax=Alexandrium andersonii TaxID=327968 RepID=A0A7S2J888_9DINO
MIPHHPHFSVCVGNPPVEHPDREAVVFRSQVPGTVQKKRRVLLPELGQVGATPTAMKGANFALQPGLQPEFAPVVADAEDAFALSLRLPPDLPHLGDYPDVAPPRHAEVLLASLPPFPMAVAGMPPTHGELATALGMLKVSVPDVGCRWPPLDEDLLEKPDQDLMQEAMKATSVDSVAKLDILAARWEAKVCEREELRRCYDWSFQTKLFRPCRAMIEALQEEESRQQAEDFL